MNLASPKLFVIIKFDSKYTILQTTIIDARKVTIAKQKRERECQAMIQHLFVSSNFVEKFHEFSRTNTKTNTNTKASHCQQKQSGEKDPFNLIIKHQGSM